MYQPFEQQIAYFCAPALAGIKPACLFSWFKEGQPSPSLLLAQGRAAFTGTDIRLRVLRECPRCCLVLVYREKVLHRQLAQPAIQSLLAEYGYDAGQSPEEMLEQLQRRCEESCGFPHEIGLFLGYPPEDVLAFAQNQGRNCKLCGHWKVYHDIEGAKKAVARFDRCRDGLCRRLDQGRSLQQLFGCRQAV